MDEEAEEPIVPAEPALPPRPEQEPEPPAEQELPADMAGLTAVEYEFLRALLGGTDYRPLLREAGAMASVTVDAINEKLFDRFGDTVLLFDGEAPELIEDYIEELKGIIGA